MNLTKKTWFAFLPFAFSIILPFFEGGETPTGLLVLHSLTILSFICLSLSSLKLWIPRFLIAFVPFFVTITLSFLLAPYKFSAFLQLMDYLMAAFFAIVLATVFRNSRENGILEKQPLLNFVVLFVATTISLVLTISTQWPRLKGTFVNPNNFATFLLLALLLGFYTLRNESRRREKRILITILCCTFLLFLFTYSRTGFLAAGAIAASYLWKERPRRGVLVAGILLILLTGTLLMYRFIHTPDPFQYYRLKIWKHSLSSLGQNPYLGIGLNMLVHQAPKLNFPADVELGRYARIARTADNQYVQILVETGFLGLLTFLVGWIGLYLHLRNLPDQLGVLKQAYLILSISAFFSLPVNNTSILFLFLFLILFALVAGNDDSCMEFKPGRPVKLLIPVVLFLIFAVAVYLPFIADFYMKKEARAKDQNTINSAFEKALRYNPYQPYYRYILVKRVVDSKPELSVEQWNYLVDLLNESIDLNPLESDFYSYRARIFSILLSKTRNLNYYTMGISSYNAAIDCSPYNAFLRVEFSVFLLQEGRYDLAEIQIQKALELEPAYLTARLIIAEIRFRRNDLKGAKEEYSKFQHYYSKYASQARNIEPPYARTLLVVNERQMKRVAMLLSMDHS